MVPAERSILKAQFAGAVAMAGALCLLAGTAFRFVPTEAFPGALARILDSLSPWFLALALLAAAMAAALGVRRTGFGLGVLAGLALGQLALQHRALSLPLAPERAADIRVLFFNALGGNAAFGDRIVSAVLATDADIVVIAEGKAIYPALARLRAHYAFVSPCAFEACELVVATRIPPKRFWRLSLNPVWDNRYAVAEMHTAGGAEFHLAASHLAKPWLVGISEAELARLTAQYDWLPGPVVALGDFNAAPWSLGMRRLLRRTGLRALRVPLPTWPARAGALGVPIDHVLVRDGARVVRVQPFGAGLNSNHRGFVADIALP
ncbi:endonuclease/exonuclease/phosphatase family protein [Rhodovulum sp.]|uniref:endonuclease/exonuclease/phosphatase family protein n=1 Tax=Rhodovulum sp. TaxID=34009 RepID=UPI0017F2655C|nr:endonuclease/exonuclease/phosphatase family protein [Rhodovulum sp.]HDR27704.1 hypothetical protein [Rhodovulum sp.]